MGLKTWSNVIVRFRTLLYVENCAIQSDFLVNGKQGECCNPMNWHYKKTVVMDETIATVLEGKTLF